MEPRRWRIQHRHHGRLGGNHPGCRLRHRQPRDSHDVGDRRARGRGRDVRRSADDVRRLGRLCDPGHGRPHVHVFRQRRRRPGRRASDRRPDRHRDRRAGQLHPFHRAGGRLPGKRAARRPGGRDDAGRAQRLAGGQWGGRNLLGRRAALQPARRSLRRCLGRHRLRRWRASPSQHLRSQQQTRPEGDGGERRRSGDEPNVHRVQQHHRRLGRLLWRHVAGCRGRRERVLAEPSEQRHLRFPERRRCRKHRAGRPRTEHDAGSLE